MLKQWTKIQETAFKNTLNAVDIIQNRTEKLVGQFWDQTAWAAEKIGDAVMDCGKIYKTGYENLQSVWIPACPAVPKSAPADTKAEDQ